MPLQTPMPLQSRYFAFDDLSADQGWALLAWCAENGADEFSVEALSTPSESARMTAFFAQLAPYALPDSPRRCLTASANVPFTRAVPLWRLNRATIALLQEALPMGFVMREYDKDLWLEDLAVFRDGEFMMGVVSHERGGVVRLTELELRSLRHTGFPDRDAVPWIGF